MIVSHDAQGVITGHCLTAMQLCRITDERLGSLEIFAETEVCFSHHILSQITNDPLICFTSRPGWRFGLLSTGLFFLEPLCKAFEPGSCMVFPPDDNPLQGRE